MTNMQFIETLKNTKEYDKFENAVHYIVWQLNDYLVETRQGVYIENNDDEGIEMMLYNDSKVEVLRKCYFGHYHYSDPYITLDAYNNLKTLDYKDVFELYIDDHDFITYCNDNDIDLCEMAGWLK
jgi:hypothetical protein